MKEEDIVIRPLETVDDFRCLEEIQAEIWSERDVVPLNQTLTAARNGGVVLGAFDKGEMIGFSYGFPGYKDGQVYLCSHMLGVKKAYRHLGIGRRLKLVQREEALRKGYQLITWTFDPLESVNANLNIAKLGGICRTYIINCYGEMKNELNRGLPTDRFLVEWHLESSRVKDRLGGKKTKRLDAGQISCAASVAITQDGLPVVEKAEYDVEGDLLRLPVPSDFQYLKSKDPNLAFHWRKSMRELAMHCFKKGWVVIDFWRAKGEPVNYYVLQRGGRI
ncbi:GNAT family N-acetyltransferase [Calderihabitans maritimus]|uniref:GCN5 N-acetyltransferase n=1 Tax=Calderihabitans maritimus TaxID=1246530 RepID=A0A1Z5HQH5_9FIRM|nr:GNAT family N-acetyltransferase [Calderihabitans maritimus]GAW91782.1 GCN5 N-acetyltransferase [Calderihabitans maritimus]